jgi:glycosyltransferase involved in cell wall biosynthesis
MRILYLSPSGALGGAERAMLEVFRALRTFEPSWTLGLIAFEDGGLVAHARAQGADATVLPMPAALAGTGEYGRHSVATLLRLTRAAAGTVRFARALRATVAAWHPDIVHTNGIKAHVLGRWVKGHGRLVWHVHDYLSPRPVSKRLLRESAQAAAAVVANSRSVAADLKAVLPDASRVEVIYNGIDVNRFRTDGPRMDLDAACGLPRATDVVRIGLVATFARWKGHEVFLRALARLPDRHKVRAYVIGDRVYQTGRVSQVSVEELRALSRELGLDQVVGFTGFLDEPASAYRSLDVVVHASTRPEPFGLCIAEAMACGRAVVISDAGGARELCEPHHTCLIHAPGDVAALSDALSRLVLSAELRERLGRAALREASRRYSHRALADAFGGLYRELAAGAV